MTKDQIRIKVAEELGWKINNSIDGCWDDPNGIVHANLPDYPSSLDACVEFEKTLTEKDEVNYVALLEEVVTEADDPVYLIKLVRATPLQRCEAFLRLKGKWEE